MIYMVPVNRGIGRGSSTCAVVNPLKNLLLVQIIFFQWLIAQLVECSLSVMKDPGSNLGADICSFPY
jgi:hypothetical protein